MTPAEDIPEEEDDDRITTMGLDSAVGTGQGAHDFPVTSWTAVLGAADPASPETRDPLERLCRLYWRPV